MNTLIKVLTGVFGATLVAAGATVMLAPAMMGARFAVDARAIVGSSTLRGIVGGLLGGLGAMMLLGLIRAEAGWFRATAVMFDPLEIEQRVLVDQTVERVPCRPAELW